MPAFRDRVYLLKQPLDTKESWVYFTRVKKHTADHEAHGEGCIGPDTACSLPAAVPVLSAMAAPGRLGEEEQLLLLLLVQQLVLRLLLGFQGRGLRAGQQLSASL